MGWGAVLSAGADLAGGILGQGSQKDAIESNEDIFRQNVQLQTDFAKNGIRWKVEDAKAAGIHPLYALGANTASFSPVSVGSFPESPLGDSISRMGQSVGRSVDATMTKVEREKKAVMDSLTLERAKLENDLLKSQIVNVNRASNPALPTSDPSLTSDFISGQGNSSPTGGLVIDKPLVRTSSQPGRPYQEVGAIPEFGYARTATGLAPIPSKDVKERIEDQLIPELMWSLRNNVLPNVWMGPPSPSERDYPIPKGHKWFWDPLRQEYRPRKKLFGPFYQ
ncbi:MAG: DNA pilot protein [Arizlama microvirus]|nr:MAG: DNA pilot protein [Arizlama microvirus]